MKKSPLSEILTGNKIVLKKHSLKLAQTMLDYVNADRERLLAFLPWVEHITTVQDEIDFITKAHSEWENCIMFGYGIFIKESDSYIGNIGVHNISWQHKWCELGYWILGKYAGQGYMSMAVQIIERELFKHGFNRVEIRCDANNEKSGNVPRRNNYTFEGTLRSHMFIANSQDLFRDTQIYSKLKGE